MELDRFYCRVITRPLVELTETEAHHIVNICRLDKGNEVELFDGRGTLATAVITRATSRKVTLQLKTYKVLKKPVRPQVVIAVSIPKGQNFDWLIGKCTELGVDRICPVLFERTVKQAANPNVVERWLSLAIASAKQCKRIFLPRIDGPTALPQVVEILKKDYPQAEIFAGSVDAGSQSLVEATFSGGDATAFIGPEGGVTESEQQLLVNKGAKLVRLTNTILRVETAALSFAAILATNRDAKSGN